jgi:hypothetical protein
MPAELTPVAEIRAAAGLGKRHLNKGKPFPLVKISAHRRHLLEIKKTKLIQ